MCCCSIRTGPAISTSVVFANEGPAANMVIIPQICPFRIQSKYRLSSPLFSGFSKVHDALIRQKSVNVNLAGVGLAHAFNPLLDGVFICLNLISGWVPRLNPVALWWKGKGAGV